MTPEEAEALPPEERWKLDREATLSIRRERARRIRAKGFWYVALTRGFPLPLMIVGLPEIWRVAVVGEPRPDWYLPSVLTFCFLSGVIAGWGMWAALGHAEKWPKW